MMKADVIRPLALGIIKHENRLLVSVNYDSVKDQTFYRLLGGGIEFGEKGEETLKREFREELGTDLEDVRFVTTIENIFKYEGRNGHEISLIFEGNLTNKKLYDQQKIQILDKDESGKATWQDIKNFKNHKLILYPEGIVDYI